MGKFSDQIAARMDWQNMKPEYTDESSKAVKIEQLMQLTHAEDMVKQMSGQ